MVLRTFLLEQVWSYGLESATVECM